MAERDRPHYGASPEGRVDGGKERWLEGGMDGWMEGGKEVWMELLPGSFDEADRQQDQRERGGNGRSRDAPARLERARWDQTRFNDD